VTKGITGAHRPQIIPPVGTPILAGNILKSQLYSHSIKQTDHQVEFLGAQILAGNILNSQLYSHSI